MLPLPLILALLVSAPTADRQAVVIVVGAAGAPEYADEFRDSAGRWKAAALKGGAEPIVIGDEPPQPGAPSDRDRLRDALAGRSGPADEPLWVVLLGHGTFDGREAKFNLRGPDVSDRDLAAWLQPLKRPVVLIDGSSASAPFLARLSGPDRVVITATRSGSEVNFARFGRYISEAIDDPGADLDKDGQVSLLEAYLSASHRVADYYRTRSQLATEHPLLDDNGDRLGTPPDWFRGVRATRRARDGASPDGLRAHQRHLVPSDRERSLPSSVRRRRDELEQAAAALRDQKARLGEEEYYRRLEAIMVELGRLYRQDSPARPEGSPGPAAETLGRPG